MAAATPLAPPSPPRRAPLSLFCLELGYLVVLALLFFAYFESDGVRDFFPTRLGQLPVATPWFGAVGAVIAGVTGHFFHYNDWDPSFNRWHISRPLLGAIEGPVGCLILVVIVRAASTKGTGTQPAFYDTVAFLVGFAEQLFRDLITKATQLILAPGGDSKQPPPAGK